ncbi:AMP-binding protein [Microbacterium sp. ASV81]|uniref:AMP-binding protein n=1 Tax=Microbacterium capsulatum TaxID=3041921 RepID=A0ABU0XKP7_9MICO|nr:AMP-binding protein [Microbacterium sp. ASV81]MDQ4215698.1 AMP-binding protein [Microbacterium sp. ASV81]
MRALATVDPADPVAFRAAVERALDGADPLALGFEPGAQDRVPDGTAVVIATSGSTGVPKRVVLSAAALRASAAATAERIGSGSWLLALPAGYVAGLQVVVRSVLAATTPAVLRGSFRPEAFAELAAALPADGARLTSLVPAQLLALVERAEQDRAVRDALGVFDALLIGGQALPVPLRERAAALGARVVRTYGSSETAGGCVYDGVPLAGVRASTDEAGELRIGGPTLADGYLGDEALTADRFVADDGGRWYRTGDLGEVVDGVVRVTGRADNVIVSGGVNVSLDRVERAVRSVPGLEGAVVVPVPDERWGQGSAIVAPAAGIAESALLAAAREQVTGEVGAPARPGRILLVDALPMLSSGKPDRRAIAELADPR